MNDVLKKLSSDFMKVYSNLPLNVRDDIVLVLHDEPVSWRVAHFEIKNDSEKAAEILESLKKLELI
jgi:hypothetical protein